MKRSRFSEEEMIGVLKEAEATKRRMPAEEDLSLFSWGSRITQVRDQDIPNFLR